MSHIIQHILRPIVGDAFELRGDLLGVLLRKGLAADVAEMRVGRQRLLLAAHPEAIRHVLRDHPDRYQKRKFAEKLKPVLGDGLATANGERWRASRRVAQDALHKTRLDGMMAGMAAATARWQERLRRRGGAPVGASPAACGLALEMVVAAIFGEDAADFAPRTIAAVEDIQQVLAERMWAVLPDIGPSRAKRRMAAAIAELEAVIADLVDRRGGRGGSDFLGLLTSGIDEATGAPFTPRQIRDEVVTMLVAGHETTGNALAWAFAEMAARPGIAARVAAEAAGLEPTVASVRDLSVTRQVVQEVLRLHPTAFWFARTAMADDSLMGVPVRRGDVILVSQYVTHRLPAFWERPEAFDAERFAAGAQVGRHPFAYIPFGAGPRTCPGGNLSMVEMTYALAAVLRDFAVEAGTPPREEALVTLRPGDATVRFLPKVPLPARRVAG